MKKTLLCLSILVCTSVFAKVQILTFHFNKPQYIKYQYLLFKKFLKHDFNLVVMNDAKNEEHINAIRTECQKYGIQHVRYEPEWHLTNPLNDYLHTQLNRKDVYSHISTFQNPHGTPLSTIASQPSIRHCHQIQYAMDHYGYDNNDYVIIIDGDAFPTREINLHRLLKRHKIIGFQGGPYENKVEYLWVPFIAMDMRKLPNKRDLKFHADVIGNIFYDTGAHTYHYLKSNPKVRAKKFPVLPSSGFSHFTKAQLYQTGFTQKEADLIKNLPKECCLQFSVDKRVVHFLNSSFGILHDQAKEREMLKFFDRILKSGN